MGETKKFTLQGANKKKLQERKTKLAYITEVYQPIYPYIYIYSKSL
jgi:hypothetical protein